MPDIVKRLRNIGYYSPEDAEAAANRIEALEAALRNAQEDASFWRKIANAERNDRAAMQNRLVALAGEKKDD